MPRPSELPPQPARWLDRVRNSQLVQVLELLGRFSIVAGLLTYLWEYPARTKQRENQAWQVISVARGGGGVVDAVTYLYQQQKSLAQANLEQAYLPSVRLPGVDLRGADLWKATLAGADLSHADFENSFLDGVNFNAANLTGAKLINASLAAAHLEWSRLDGSDLTGVSHLTQEQLDRACATKTITLPEGYTEPKADCSGITWRTP